jgi:poly(A) polymerase
LTASTHPALIETNPEQAVLALDYAVCAAQKKPGEHPVVLANPEDFREAIRRFRPEVRQRLDHILLGEDPEAGLDAMLVSGALDAFFPEIKAMVGFGDGEWRHKDVWKHTKQVVRQATPKVEVRWGALLHDIGKVRTRSISASGEVHFFGHAEVGARMFDKLERRMGLFGKEGKLRETIRFLILFHLRPAGYDRGWTDSAVRRFGKELGDHLNELLCLARADITTKRPEKKRRGLQQISELEKRIQEIQEADSVVPPLPKGVGDCIMKSFALPPSRKIGELKRVLEALVDAGDLEAFQESEYYVAYLAENRERFGLPDL